jgi:hypothetical protein
MIAYLLKDKELFKLKYFQHLVALWFFIFVFICRVLSRTSLHLLCSKGHGAKKNINGEKERKRKDRCQ